MSRTSCSATLFFGGQTVKKMPKILKPMRRSPIHGTPERNSNLPRCAKGKHLLVYFGQGMGNSTLRNRC